MNETGRPPERPATNTFPAAEDNTGRGRWKPLRLAEARTRCSCGSLPSRRCTICRGELGDRSTVVITAELSDRPDLARRATNSILVSAPGSSHFVVSDRPQLVVESVRLVVTAARSGTRLPACEQTPLPTVGGKCDTFTP